METAIDVNSFRKASESASQVMDLVSSASEASRVSKQFQATVLNIEETTVLPRLKERLESLDADSLEALVESMDNMSLRFAAIRSNLRSAPRLFRLMFFRSIRRFYANSEKMLKIIENVRANLPDRSALPSPEELEADAALLARLRRKEADWVSLDDVLQKDDPRCHISNSK